MSRATQESGVKSLEDVSNGESRRQPARKTSLLVDYSKKRADITAASSASTTDTERRTRLLGSFGKGQSKGTTDDIIGRALEALGSPVQAEDDRQEDAAAAPISFRLRKSSVGRCKSFDERKISTYENLQNSLRNLMHEEGAQEEISESSSGNDDPAMSCSMPAVAASTANDNRRLQLARMKHRNHQSMRQLTTNSGSTKELMKSLGGRSEHGSGPAATSPVNAPTRVRRPTLRGEKGSLRSASSRNLIRRSRTMPNKAEISTTGNSLATGSFHGQDHDASRSRPKDSLSSASEHSYLKKPVMKSKSAKLSARRTSLMTMSESMPAADGISCRRSMALRSHSTSSRRDLLANCNASSNNHHDSFSNLDLDASHFVTGSRIRRHGSVRKLIVED